jgi:hypothetical protein
VPFGRIPSRPVKRLMIVAAIAMLTVTGCGTAHPANPLATATNVPANNAFLTNATTACTAALNLLTQRPFPYSDFNQNDPAVSELPAVGAFYDAQKFNHDELAFAQGLGEPTTGQGTWKVFVNLVGQEQTAMASQISAAKAANKTGFLASVKQLAAIESEIDSIAAAAGFAQGSDCILLFG